MMYEELYQTIGAVLHGGTHSGSRSGWDSKPRSSKMRPDKSASDLVRETPGGTIIKRKWLATYDEVTYQPGDRIVLSWDIALSETKSGDYSACVVLLIRNEVVFILEVIRGRFPFETLKKKVIDLKQRYRPSTLLIEESPISLGLIQSVRERSVNVTTYKPDQGQMCSIDRSN